MIAPALLTAESFEDARYDLPEGGQWVELVRGRVEILTPPEEEHRIAVLNLSKALAGYLNEHREGYPCFELGLLLKRDPDTIRFPAISYFIGGEFFGETDKSITENRPALVVEVMSSNDRRRSLNDRVFDYTNWGVEVLWIVDPLEKAVHTIRPGYANKRASEDETLTGSLSWRHKATAQPILPDFRIAVADIFTPPEYWQTSSTEPE
jgi:Uma2 family endonuclease